MIQRSISLREGRKIPGALALVVLLAGVDLTVLGGIVALGLF